MGMGNSKLLETSPSARIKKMLLLSLLSNPSVRRAGGSVFVRAFTTTTLSKFGSTPHSSAIESVTPSIPRKSTLTRDMSMAVEDDVDAAIDEILGEVISEDASEEASEETASKKDTPKLVSTCVVGKKKHDESIRKRIPSP